MPYKIKMDVKQKALIKKLCDLIKQRRLISFYYESKSSGKKEWRTIEPYIIAENLKGNLILVGLPIEQRTNAIKKSITPHYLIDKINIGKLEMLSETFEEPKVERHRIETTPTIKIICRFKYEDE